MKKITFADIYTPQLLKANPEKIYVFGDNLIKKGTGGQACIRNLPNAFGVPTKRLPNNENESFFSDQEDEKEAVLVSLRELYILRMKGKEIVFPSSFIGTGRALLSLRSPKLWIELTNVLDRHFFDVQGIRVAVVGSRNFSSYNFAKKEFDYIRDEYQSKNKEFSLIVSGGASSGGDLYAERISAEERIPKRIYKADWDYFGKKAGMYRNPSIVLNADVVIAFWDGKSSGTKNAIETFKKYKGEEHLHIVLGKSNRK